MRFADVLGLALTALWQRKLRTVLTLLGVVFGTMVLAASLSLGRGVQDTIVREYSRHNELRNINVYPDRARGDPPEAELRVEGRMSDERRKRLREALAERWRRYHAEGPPVRLTPERLEWLRQLPHVEAVRPTVLISGRAVLGEHVEDATFASANFTDDRLRGRLVAGRLPDADDESRAVVGEALLYFLGAHDEADVEGMMGRKLRVEYRVGGRSPHLLLMLLRADATGVGPDDEKVLDRALDRLPAALAGMDLSEAEKARLKRLLARRSKLPHQQGPERTVSREFALAGVVRAARPGERRPDDHSGWADVLLGSRAAEEIYLRAPQHRERGFDSAVVTAGRPEDVKELADAIRGEGLHAYSPMEMVERERFIYLLVFGGMTCIAVIALVVAALGIANTMLIGVLERTREIGVLKAVGARDGAILLMFLVEGALVGLVGGLLGLLLSWLLSFPGDAWVRSMVSRQLTVKLEESLFAFPAWLVAGAPLFAMLVTTLAAVLPARRAARVNPVEALRHE